MAREERVNGGGRKIYTVAIALIDFLQKMLFNQNVITANGFVRSRFSA